MGEDQTGPKLFKLLVVAISMLGLAMPGYAKFRQKSRVTDRPTHRRAPSQDTELRAPQIEFELFNRPKREIEIGEAVRLLIDKNLSLQVSKWDLRIARLNHEFFFWKEHYPSLEVGWVSDHKTTRTGPLGTAPSSLQESIFSRSDSVALSVVGKIPHTGIEYRLSPLAMQRESLTGSSSTFRAGSSASLQVNLLRSFGPLAYSISRDVSDLTLNTARAQANTVLVQEITEMKAAFWDLYLTQRQLELEKQNLDSSRRLVAEARERIRAGTLPKVVINDALSNFHTSQTEYLLAQSALVEQHQRFQNYLMDRETDEAVMYIPVVSGELLKQTASRTLDFDNLYQAMLKSNPNLRLSRSTIRTLERSHHSTRRFNWPELKLFVSASKFGQNDESFSETFEGYSRDNQGEIAYGVNFVWSFPNYSGRYDSQSERLEIQKLKTQLQRDSLYFRHLLSSTVQRVEVLKASITSSDLASTAARSNFGVELERYRQGLSTQKDIIDFQQRQKEALLRALFIQVDLAKAYLIIDSLVGNVSEP